MSITANAAPSTAAESLGTETIDLREFYRRMGFAGRSVVRTAGAFRRVVELVETDPVAVTAQPMAASASVDGIQASRVITRRQHRDVLIAYLAAGAVAGRRITRLEERLVVVCSHLDEAEVRKACPPIQVQALDEQAPWDIPLACDSYVDQLRRSLERTVVETAPPTAPGEFLILGGSLPADLGRQDVVGVVKGALETDWLNNEHLLPDRGGWRSPAMRFPAQRRGECRQVVGPH